jgi:hypothetical protein
MRGVRDSRVVLLLSLAAAAVGCGDEPAGASGPDPRTCSHNWEIIYSPERDTSAPWGDWHELQAAGDRLYLKISGARTFANNGIFSMPAGGGDLSRVTQLPPLTFWLEDDRILSFASQTLTSQPLAGGEPEALFTIGQAGNPDVLRFRPLALDRDALYWGFDERPFDDNPGVEIWHRGRVDGEDRPLVYLPDFDPNAHAYLDNIFLVGDQIYAQSYGGLWTFPKTGGEVRRIAAADTMENFLGIDDDGTTLWSRHVGTGDDVRREVVRIGAADDQVTPLWSGPVDDFTPLHAWPDGSGSWYVATSERGVDASPHVTISTLEARGQVTRIACDPIAGSVARLGAVTPDHLYVLVIYDNLYWEIAAVSRVPIR